MLSIYSNPFLLILKLQYNNSYQKISVKTFLEIPTDTKNIYCNTCKQWIDLNESKIHQEKGHTLTDKIEILGKCEYHSYRTSKVICLNCNLVMCSLCYESFIIHKNHCTVFIEHFYNDEYIEEAKNFINYFKEQLIKLEIWLYNIIIQKKLFQESQEFIMNKDYLIQNTLQLFIKNQKTQENNELVVLSKTLLLYIDLHKTYSKLLEDYENKKSVINYFNIINNIYYQQNKFEPFKVFTNNVDCSSQTIPKEYLNNSLFQPFQSYYTIHYVSTSSMKDDILCLTKLKNKVIATGSSRRILFYSFFNQTKSFYLKGCINIGVSSIQEGKDNLIYLSTFEGIEIITLNASYTSYTKLHVINEKEMRLTFMIEFNAEPIGHIILRKQQDIIYYLNLQTISRVYYYRYEGVDKYDGKLVVDFEKKIYKLIFTEKTDPIIVCSFLKNIKIISLDTKAIIAEITDQIYNPIEISDGIILCLGTKGSILFPNLTHTETAEQIKVNNENLKNYNGLKYEPLVLEGNDIVLYNGTQFNIAEIRGEKFFLHNSSLEVQMEYQGRFGEILPFIIHKDEQNSSYLIAIVNKFTYKVIVLQIRSN